MLKTQRNDVMEWKRWSRIAFAQGSLRAPSRDHDSAVICPSAPSRGPRRAGVTLAAPDLLNASHPAVTAKRADARASELGRRAPAHVRRDHGRLADLLSTHADLEDASSDGLVTVLSGDRESNAAQISLTPLGRAARDRRPMTVSILDDYFDTVHTLPCFAKLAPFDVTIWNDHVEDVDVLAERLQRQRRPDPDPRANEDQAPLLGAPRQAPAHQPAQRLSPHRYRRLHAKGRDCFVQPARGHAVLCRRGVDLGAGARRDAADSGTGRSAQARRVANRRGRDLARKDARHLRLRADRQSRGRLRESVRHERVRVGARGGARAGARRWIWRRLEQRGVLRRMRRHLPAHAAGRGDAWHRDGGGSRRG